jgi:hypothetical protein
MIDGVPWPAQLGVGSGWALVCVFVIMIYRGNLVPRRAVNDMIRAHEREMEDISHDRGEWRTAHRISETARLEAVGQVHELLEHARTTDQFIRSLPTPRQEAT